MGKKYRIYTYLLIFLLVLSLNLTLVSSQPYIGEDDVYSKDINLGESKNFYWTVYKNSTENYSVFLDVNGLDDWTYDISPSNFILSDENKYEIVSLTITVPKFPEKEKQTGSVVFSYRKLDSSEKFEITKNIDINVVGLAYIGGENTIIGGFQNPLPAPLDNPFGALFLNIIIWVGIAVLIYILIKYFIHVFAKKTKTKLDDALINIIRKPVLIIVILYGIINSIVRLGLTVGFQESLYQIFSFVVLGIIIYIIYRVYNEILDEITARKGGDNSSFGKVLRPIFKILGAVVIVVGGLIYGLNIFGIEVTALLAGAGVFGLVIAFAAQDTLSNFFSGIHLLLDRPFHIGDLILLSSGEYCRVESVGMRSTKLYSLFDHELIILPNNTVANEKIINIVKPDTKIRQNIEVGVAYGSDIKKVKKILYDSAINHPDVLEDDEYKPVVRFTGFGDSSLDFLLLFYVDDVMKRWSVKSDIVSDIDERFRKNNITIPFPQRTVWLNEKK